MENSVNGAAASNLNQTVQIPLPNSTGVLVMGIISIALYWCTGIVGITLGIIAIVLGNKAKKLYKENPEKYFLWSYKNLHTGYICAIIGLFLSTAFLLFIIYFLIMRAALSTAFSTFP